MNELQNTWVNERKYLMQAVRVKDVKQSQKDANSPNSTILVVLPFPIIWFPSSLVLRKSFF